MEAIKTGITVANLRRTDIQKVSTYDYKNYEKTQKISSTSAETIYFGSSKTYDNNNKYPSMWEKYDSQWTYGYDGKTETGSDKECEMWEREYEEGTMTGEGKGDANTTFRQSYYDHAYKKDEFINETYYDLLFIDPETGEPFTIWYWLAGRGVELERLYCGFGLQYVRTTKSACNVLCYSLYKSNR